MSICTNLFQSSVDELLNDSPLLGSFDYKNMLYWDAFRFLYSAVSGGAINVSSIDDYFLKYLISEAARIDGNDSISSKKKENWYKKVKTDFSIPVFEKHFLDLYLNRTIESFAEVAEYDSYATRARKLNTWRAELVQKLNDIVPPDDETIGYFNQWLEENKQETEPLSPPFRPSTRTRRTSTKKSGQKPIRQTVFGQFWLELRAFPLFPAQGTAVSFFCAQKKMPKPVICWL